MSWILRCNEMSISMECSWWKRCLHYNFRKKQTKMQDITTVIQEANDASWIIIIIYSQIRKAKLRKNKLSND